MGISKGLLSVTNHRNETRPQAGEPSVSKNFIVQGEVGHQRSRLKETWLQLPNADIYSFMFL